MPKKKKALALKEISDVLTDGGLMVARNFFTIANHIENKESDTDYKVWRQVWRYFGGDELPENRAEFKPTTDELAKITSLTRKKMNQIARHVSRIERIQVLILKKISRANEKDFPILQQKINRVMEMFNRYVVIGKTLEEFTNTAERLYRRDKKTAARLLCQHIGNKLRTIRIQNKLTQQAAADKLKITREAWRTYESGTRDTPTIFLRNIAATFNVNLNWLFGFTYENQDRIKNEVLAPAP